MEQGEPGALYNSVPTEEERRNRGAAQGQRWMFRVLIINLDQICQFSWLATNSRIAVFRKKNVRTAHAA